MLQRGPPKPEVMNALGGPVPENHVVVAGHRACIYNPCPKVAAMLLWAKVGDHAPVMVLVWHDDNVQALVAADVAVPPPAFMPKVLTVEYVKVALLKELSSYGSGGTVGANIIGPNDLCQAMCVGARA